MALSVNKKIVIYSSVLVRIKLNDHVYGALLSLVFFSPPLIVSYIGFFNLQSTFLIYPIIYELFPLWDDSKTLSGVKLFMLFILEQLEAYRKHRPNWGNFKPMTG